MPAIMQMNTVLKQPRKRLILVNWIAYRECTAPTIWIQKQTLRSSNRFWMMPGAGMPVTTINQKPPKRGFGAAPLAPRVPTIQMNSLFL